MRRALSFCAALTALAACASSGGERAYYGESGADQRIRLGMTRLGATESRGDCFAKRIAGSLNGPDADEAAAIVERATSRAEMRENVLSASGPVRKAFIGANFRCSLFS